MYGILNLCVCFTLYLYDDIYSKLLYSTSGTESTTLLNFGEDLDNFIIIIILYVHALCIPCNYLAVMTSPGRLLVNRVGNYILLFFIDIRYNSSDFIDIK